MCVCVHVCVCVCVCVCGERQRKRETKTIKMILEGSQNFMPGTPRKAKCKK